MADLDWGEMLSDPRILIGLQLLGGSNPRNAPLAAVAQTLQGMKKQKMQEQQMKAQQAQDAMHMDLYGQQIAASKQKLAQDLQMQQQQQQFMGGIGNYLKSQGMDMGMGGMGQQPAAPQMPMQAPQMPQSSVMDAGLNAQQAQPQPAQQPQAAPSFFQTKIIQQESRGQQFRPDGSPLLSPKGAVGIAQVMPTTGPEAAKLAGLPWDQTRLYKDPQYNAALGEAYFNKQLQDFGRPDYAAAAYNAGPTATQRAIDTANKANRPELWTAFLPKETQDYVKKTAGDMSGQATQQQTPPPPASPMGLRNTGQPLIAAGAMAELAGLKGGQGLIELGKSMESKQLTPGSYQQDNTGQLRQVPNPLGERQAATAEGNLDVARQKLEQEKRIQDRQDVKANKDLNSTYARDKVAYEMVSGAADRMSSSVNNLISSPGLEKITGIHSLTNKAAIPGSEAYNSLAQLKSLTSKIINDTLQAVRQASANGASGYGSFSEKELEVVQNYVASLDPGQGKDQFIKALKQVDTYAKDIKTRSKDLYESSTGKSIGMKDLPQGAQLIGTSGGKKVYQLPDGSKFKED